MSEEDMKAGIAEGMVTETTAGLESTTVGGKVDKTAKTEMNKKAGINLIKEEIWTDFLS